MPIYYYPKLAYDSIRKNKQLYVPFIITCILMVSIFYIVTFIATSEDLKNLPGSGALASMLFFGSFVMIIFSVIFLFYTNTFLIKRRKKEFGLYSILGLSKGNIIRILFFEYLIIGTISIVLGLLIGILFSKLFELGLYKVLEVPANYNFSISSVAIITTVVVFSCIFILLLFNTFLQVKFTKISQLLISEATGEKPPKGNWIIALLGILSLGTGYFIALNIQNPIEALSYFFIAVVFVIIGTYLLLISGSVLFCRLLQKNKSFYYKINHFISVSSMAYRMKRNGAGLASICILSTMVLVTMCTTVCLYIGTEDTISYIYQRQLNTHVQLNSVEDLTQDNFNRLNNYIDNVVHENNAVVLEPYNYMSSTFNAKIDDNNLKVYIPDFSEMTADEINDYCTLVLLPLGDYNRISGLNETLGMDEVIVVPNRYTFESNTITLNDNLTFKVKEVATDTFHVDGELAAYVIPSITLVVPDIIPLTSELIGNYPIEAIKNNIKFNYVYNFDTGDNEQLEVAITQAVNDALDMPEIREQTGIIYSECNSRIIDRSDFLSLYGGLFYLGFILSIIFILATVLIIYYKQISEGFEDKARFGIMQKVGLSNKEIKKTINSQLLTVFFIPLVFAIINLCFAFPVMVKMLMMFNFYNVKLFIMTTIGCVIVFSIFYSIVYKITSNEYYKIVT